MLIWLADILVAFALVVVRDWVLRFNAEGLGGLLNDKAPATPTIGKMSTFKS